MKDYDASQTLGISSNQLDDVMGRVSKKRKICHRRWRV